MNDIRQAERLAEIDRDYRRALIGLRQMKHRIAMIKVPNSKRILEEEYGIIESKIHNLQIVLKMQILKSDTWKRKVRGNYD